MKKEFVAVQNAQRLRAHVTMAEARGAAESSWIVVQGRPGEGKTSALLNWAAERGAVMLTGQVDWTVTRMMRDLAGKLGLEHDRTSDAKIKDAIQLDELPLIVDEAGFALSNGAACLEKLRGITDATNTLVILVLMEQDVPKLARRTQITSRASICQFMRATLDDVAMACRQLTDVEIAPDLVARIHAEADGRMRLVMGAISRVEAAGARLRKARVELADVKEFALCDDFMKTMRTAARRRQVSQ